jgi:prepilin-type N-terminal cleavage/methylation domain-containing protein
MNKKGFTLIELLVVIATIGILSTIVISNVSSAREKGSVAASQLFLNTVRNEVGDSLVLSYTFDIDSLTSSIGDISGLNNFGWVVNGSGSFSSDSPTKKGKTLSLSSGAAVRSAAPVPLTGEDFTISYWVKTTSPGRTGGIANTGSADGFRFSLMDGAIYYLAGGVAGANYSEGSCGGAGLNNGAWHHIVGVFKLSSRKVICFADGKKVGEVTLPGIITNMPSYVVQAGTPTCCNPFTGLIDDVRIYTKPLSIASVESLYEESQKRYLATQ